jgi:hypothetical protein
MKGMLANPTVYTASNLTCVIEGNSFSDESVSTQFVNCPIPPAATTVPSATDASSVLTAPHEDIAPLTVPHLY